MRTLKRADALIAQELDELLSKSPPYSLSTPQFGNPTLHDFVKGLIISSNIIEVIEKHLPNGYRADWGQVIDVEDGNTLSKECDIIIYRGKAYKHLKNKSISFVLVDKKQAKIVIQVRSSIQSATRDSKEYCRAVKRFVPEVWYVAECCWAKSEKRSVTIGKDLKKMGYKRFVYFYRFDETSAIRQVNYKSFVGFIKSIKNIR